MLAKLLLVPVMIIGPKGHETSVTVTIFCLLGAVMEASPNYLLLSQQF